MTSRLALALALKLFKLAIAPPTVASLTAVARPEQILAHRFKDRIAANDLKHAETLLMGARDALGDTESILRAARLLSEIVSRASQDELAADNQIVDELMLLGAGYRKSAMATLHLAPTDPDLFSYIITIRIEPSSDQALVYIIGTLPAAIVNADVPIQLRSERYIESKTDINYRPQVQSPLLNVTWPSLTKHHSIPDRRPQRWDWRQEAREEYDLEVYNYSERLVGRIRTRIRELPHTVDSRQLSITIPHIPGVTLLETTISDAHSTLLTRCLRLAGD